MANNERLISAWKLVSVLAKKFRSGMIHYDDLMATIADVPTVDAVEVVRCRDCKFADEFGEFNTSVCYRRNNVVLSDGFCSYGERREGE